MTRDEYDASLGRGVAEALDSGLTPAVIADTHMHRAWVIMALTMSSDQITAVLQEQIAKVATIREGVVGAMLLKS